MKDVPSLRQPRAASRQPQAASRKPRAAGREPPSASRQPGFTLIELIVSMSVSVGIVAGAYLCLNGGMESRKICELRMDLIQNARVALSLITRDLACACTLSEEYEFVGMRRTLGDMEADNLDFATHNWRPRSPGEGDFCEVSYFVDRDRKTGEMGLWRRRDPSPDENPLDGGSREEIAEGIAAFRLEYSDGFEWYDSWGSSETPRDRTSTNLSSYNLGGLPEAVRITIAFKAPGESSLAPPEGRSERKEAAGEKTSGAPGADRGAPAGRGSPQPPLVFQTVVRLNLAARAAEKYSRRTGDSTIPGDSEGGPAAPSEGGKR